MIVLSFLNKIPFSNVYMVFPLSTLISVNFSQSENGFPSIFVTELGMVTVVRPLQALNAASSILTTELGIVMEVRPLQP